MGLPELVNSPSFLNNRNIETFNILFQVYATLSGLKEIYTHYDLHTGNVAFVPVPEGKTTQVVYHMGNKEYHIHTRFIPVILDYGRSHIDCTKFGSKINSKAFANVGCSISHCQNRAKPNECQLNSGLHFTKDSRGNFSSNFAQYFIVPANRNISHDLRYLYMFMHETTRYQDGKAPVNIHRSFNMVENKSWYNNDPKYYYGIPENMDNLTGGVQLKNVSDALRWLISNYDKIYSNNPIVNNPKFGRMDIYPEINKGFREWTFTS